MISIEEFEIMLDELAEELPQDFYKDLNGGIILLPEAKVHPQSINNDLYILGEYHNNINMGRYIVIYYGSFIRIHGNLSRENMKMKLNKTLKHEFVHHMESLSGLRDLEIEDEKDLLKYKRRKK